MVWKILTDDFAKTEIEEALEYYSGVSFKATDHLGRELAEALRSLSINPFFAVRYRQIRCLPLKSFPYMLHYQIFELAGVIKVIGFIHTSQDPLRKWR